VFAMEWRALPGTPVLLDATLVRALPAQLRHSQRNPRCPVCVDLRHPLFVSNSQIAAIAEGRAEWVKPTLEREFAVAVVRPQGAQKLPLRATLPLSRPQLSTP
jgi:hypothetical protein